MIMIKIKIVIMINADDDNLVITFLQLPGKSSKKNKPIISGIRGIVSNQ